MNITQIQKLLNEYNLDAWMMYDFRGINSIAWKICGVPANAHCTRRWAVIVPRKGEAIKIVSAIEAHSLANVEAKEIRYAKAESQRLFRYMFYVNTVPHLPRKFAKMQKTLTIAAGQVDRRYT